MCGVAVFMVSWLLLMIVVTGGGKVCAVAQLAGLNHSYSARQSTLCFREDFSN